MSTSSLVSTGSVCLHLQLKLMFSTSFFFDFFFSREKELAKKYYDKLFKEYCIADLSKFKENKVGNRICKGFKWNGDTAKMEIMCCFYIVSLCG